MTTGTEALVRRAYHLAEGDVLDARGVLPTSPPFAASAPAR